MSFPADHLIVFYVCSISLYNILVTGVNRMVWAHHFIYYHLFIYEELNDWHHDSSTVTKAFMAWDCQPITCCTCPYHLYLPEAIHHSATFYLRMGVCVTASDLLSIIRLGIVIHQFFRHFLLSSHSQWFPWYIITLHFYM